jgi:putative PIN family toxin of toxin-antitoxin system
MISAVFDCVVYVQAAISDGGPAAACLGLVEAGNVHVYVSPAVLAECQETLSRDKLRQRFPHLTDEKLESFLQRVGAIAELVEDIPPVFSLARDPDDAMYVDLAVSTKAGILVTRDKDLLDLMDDAAFHASYPGLTIMAPAAFLAHVRSQIATEPG